MLRLLHRAKENPQNKSDQRPMCKFWLSKNSFFEEVCVWGVVGWGGGGVTVQAFRMIMKVPCDKAVEAIQMAALNRNLS